MITTITTTSTTAADTSSAAANGDRPAASGDDSNASAVVHLSASAAQNNDPTAQQRAYLAEVQQQLAQLLALTFASAGTGKNKDDGGFKVPERPLLLDMIQSMDEDLTIKDYKDRKDSKNQQDDAPVSTPLTRLLSTYPPGKAPGADSDVTSPSALASPSSAEAAGRLQDYRQIGRDSAAYRLMLQRIFNLSDPAQEAAVATRASLSTQDRDTLTGDDRKLLAALYQYAQEQGIDLQKVDDFAADLMHFRFMQIAGTNLETRQGTLWNTDGSPLYFRMREGDAAIASRILHSQAAAQTMIDRGFIAYILNPRGGGWVTDTNQGHALDFAFLEQIIKASMPDAGEAPQKPAALSAQYQNAQHWIDHQDVPVTPPPGWNGKMPVRVDIPATSLAAANEIVSRHDLAQVDLNYVRGALALMQRRLRKDKSLARELEEFSELVSEQLEHNGLIPGWNRPRQGRNNSDAEAGKQDEGESSQS